MDLRREDRTFSGLFRHTLVIRWPPDTPPSFFVFRSNAWTVGFLLCMRSIWVQYP